MYRLKRENATSTDGKVTVQADKDRFKINVDGKSTQATRDGKNEFNLDYVPDGSSYVIKTDTGVNLIKTWVSDIFGVNSSDKVKATFKPNTTYTMKAKAKVVSRPTTFVSHQNAIFLLYRPFNNELGGFMQAVLNMSDKETIALNTEKEYITSFTTPEDMTDVRFISYTFYGNNDGSTTGTVQGEIDVSEIMLVEGKYTAENFPNFELYGVSPSPDYPSEIKSIGDDINLFDESVLSGYTDRGITWKYDNITKKINISGTASSSYSQTNYLSLSLNPGTYYFSIFGNTSLKYGIWFYNSANKLIGTIKASGSAIITEDVAKIILFVEGLTSGNNYLENMNFKLQKGDKSTPYSKYGEGTLNIEQSSKNLLNVTAKTTTAQGMTFTVNEDKSVTINGTNTGTGTYFFRLADNFVLPAGAYTLSNKNSNAKPYGFLFYDDGGNFPRTNISNAIFTADITIKPYIRVDKGITIDNQTIYPMIIEGTYTEQTIPDYEPYFNKTYTLPLSEPLRSLPNGVKDTLEADGIHRRVKKIILDGSENWVLYPNKTNTFRYPMSALISTGLSNYYKRLFSATKFDVDTGIYLEYTNSIIISDPRFSTIDELKTWLSTHNVEVIYNVRTATEPVIETIESYTDEQKEIINSMVTEKGTNIFDINEDTGITLNYTPEFTDEIKHAFRYGVTRGYLEVLDDSELIINEDNYLQSIDFDDERYVDGEGIIGTTVAKSLEGKFVNVDSEFSVENKELQAYIGAELDDGTTKYIDLGTFIVQKPDNDNVKDNTSFTSLDYMVKFNQTYKDTITYPCTLGQLLQNVCDQVGIVLGTKTFRNSNFLVENNQFVNNESCREVLKAIAQMAFSWARINQDNELVLDFNLIDEPTAEFDYDEYYDLTSNEQYGPVNTIILKNSQVEGENYTVKDQDLIDETGKEIALTISDNPFAYTQAKRSQLIQAGKKLFGFKYIPFTTKTIGYIYLNCQDKVRIKNMQDKLLDSYLFNNKFSYEGTISDNKETSAMTETETKYQFTDTVENKLNAKITRTEIIVDKANQEITAVVKKQTEYDEDLTEIKAGLGSITSTVEEIKNFKRSKQSTNEIYITDAMEDGTLSFTAIGNESVNVVLFPLDNLYPSDDLYGGNEYDG